MILDSINSGLKRFSWASFGIVGSVAVGWVSYWMDGAAGPSSSDAVIGPSSGLLEVLLQTCYLSGWALWTCGFVGIFFWAFGSIADVLWLSY